MCLAGLTLVVVGFFFFFGGAEYEDTGDYVTEVTFDGAGESYEVRVYSNPSKTVLLQKGVEPVTLSLVPRQGVPHLTLPKTSTAVDYLSLRAPTSDLTWNLKLGESAEYVNYLYEQGYEKLQEVQTPQFVELILKHGQKRTRMVIFNEVMMLGDLDDSANLPTISDYTAKYGK